MVMPVRDLKGQRFGRLTAVEMFRQGKRIKWKCICDCGMWHIAYTHHLVSGNVQSCGCLRVDNKKVHGMYYTSTYKAWIDMIQRCTNPNNTRYKDWGGRGITVCERWRTSFANFYADMGKKPNDDLSLDRIDNDGNYEPSNCRWADIYTQAANRRRSVAV